MTYILCCSKCGKSVAETKEIVVHEPVYFNCHDCEVSSIRNAAYLDFTGQSQELREQHVSNEQVEKALEERMGPQKLLEEAGQ